MSETEAKGSIMTLGLRSVIYSVADIDVAKDWYSDVFEVDPYFDEPYYVGYQIGGSELGLDPDLTANAPGPGGQVAHWGVADILATVNRINALEIEILEPIRDIGGGVLLAVIADPFGNPVGLIQQP